MAFSVLAKLCIACILICFVGCNTGQPILGYKDLWLAVSEGDASSFVLNIPRGGKSQLVKAITVKDRRFDLENVTLDLFHDFAKSLGENPAAYRDTAGNINSIKTSYVSMHCDSSEITLSGHGPDVGFEFHSGKSFVMPTKVSEVKKILGPPDRVHYAHSGQP